MCGSPDPLCKCICNVGTHSQSLYSEVRHITTRRIFSRLVGRVHLPRFFFPITLHQRINNNTKVNTKMTPRSLVQNPGRVYSMPQGTGLKFLEIGTRLPMWIASASYEVERSGSTMYDTPSILAQLGECDTCITMCCQVRIISIQPANSPDMKACISLRPVRPHTCRLGVLTKVEYLPRIRLFLIGRGPPRDAKNCDVCHTGG